MQISTLGNIAIQSGAVQAGVISQYKLEAFCTNLRTGSKQQTLRPYCSNIYIVSPGEMVGPFYLQEMTIFSWLKSVPDHSQL